MKKIQDSTPESGIKVSGSKSETMKKTTKQVQDPTPDSGIGKKCYIEDQIPETCPRPYSGKWQWKKDYIRGQNLFFQRWNYEED